MHDIEQEFKEIKERILSNKNEIKVNKEKIQQNRNDINKIQNGEYM